VFTSENETAYTLFQKDIIPQLTDRNFFIACIAYNYAKQANAWGCTAIMSERRLGEAYDFWIADQNRTLKEGMPEGTETLDHFKHASFISFWLRRMLPINNTNAGRPVFAVDPKIQNFFMRYGNELCALLVGFHICLFYEASLERVAGTLSVRKDRLEYLRKCRIPEHTIQDFVMILKHKNMSPHALYLLYKSLFTTIRP
jgi:hypothetical protein